MNLWLARHAQPLIGAGICYGILDIAADTALTTAAANALAADLPANTACFISPLRRCQQLAAALALLRPDLSINSNTCTDMRLAEMDFGDYEGQAWANIPKAAFDAWAVDFGNHRFGGQESANEVLQRVKAAIDEHAKLQAEHVLWITHAGNIRACSLISQGIYRVVDSAQWPQSVVEFGSFININYSLNN
jgi:alpha-ribazole phosphatase